MTDDNEVLGGCIIEDLPGQLTMARELGPYMMNRYLGNLINLRLKGFIKEEDFEDE